MSKKSTESRSKYPTRLELHEQYRDLMKVNRRQLGWIIILVGALFIAGMVNIAHLVEGPTPNGPTPSSDVGPGAETTGLIDSPPDSDEFDWNGGWENIPVEPAAPYESTLEPVDNPDGPTESSIINTGPIPGSTFRITCYGPPAFPETNYVARWPMTVRECLDWSAELGLDGICAVGRGTPWWSDIYDDPPQILTVEDHGRYLVCDRIGIGSDVDIWVPDPHPGGTYFAHIRKVTAGSVDLWEWSGGSEVE